MAVNVGQAYVTVAPTVSKGFNSALAGQMAVATPIAAKAGSRAAAGFSASFAAKASAAGSAMTKGLTLPLIALGAVAVATANEFDKAYKTIRAGFSGSAQELAGLESSLRKVNRNATQGVGEVAKVIDDLNDRTGATGPGALTPGIPTWLI